MKMHFGKLFLTGMALSTLVITSVHAESLRSDANDIFSEPATGGFTQIIMSLAEAKVAQAVWPGMEFEEAALKASESKLATVEELPTSVAQKEAMMGAVVADQDSYNMGAITNNARLKIAKINAMDVVDATEKAKRIAAAQVAVAKATENGIIVAESRGFIHNSIRVVRAGTSLIFSGDVLARLYIWNVLDANPTFSPIGDLTAKGVAHLLGY